MDIDLHCYLVFSPNALVYYGYVVPGGSAFSIPVQQDGLPRGWVLPRLVDLKSRNIRVDMGWYNTVGAKTWQRVAAVPEETGDGVYALEDHVIGALLSRGGAPGVMMLHVQQRGEMAQKHAAVYRNGRLVAAAGSDTLSGLAYKLDKSRYVQESSLLSSSPTEYCSMFLDQRFAGVGLHGSYLPRECITAIDEAIADGWKPPSRPLVMPARLLMQWFSEVWHPGPDHDDSTS